jgi:hypothetical protein
MPDSPEEKDSRNFVRFDFPPGATSAQIAAAIEAARKKLVAEYAERQQQEAEEKSDDPE